MWNARRKFFKMIPVQKSYREVSGQKRPPGNSSACVGWTTHPKGTPAS